LLPGNLLLLYINKLNIFFGIDSGREVINIESKAVLSYLNLIIAFGKLFEHESKSFFVVKISAIDQFILISSFFFWIFLVKLHLGLLKAGAAKWEHFV
jgi:hypothetical protein